MLILAFKYSILVFLAVCAILQLAAVHNNLRGLQFVKNRGLAISISLVVLTGTIAVFFTWNYINAVGVIEGSQQAEFFAISGTLALLFSLLVSSLINRSMPTQGTSAKSGLQALENATFLQLLRNNWVKQSK